MLSSLLQGTCRLIHVVLGGYRNHTRRCVVWIFISLSMSIRIEIKDASCVQQSLHLIEGCSVSTCQRQYSLLVIIFLTIIGWIQGWSDNRAKRRGDGNSSNGRYVLWNRFRSRCYCRRLGGHTIQLIQVLLQNLVFPLQYLAHFRHLFHKQSLAIPRTFCMHSISLSSNLIQFRWGTFRTIFPEQLVIDSVVGKFLNLWQHISSSFGMLCARGKDQWLKCRKLRWVGYILFWSCQ